MCSPGMQRQPSSGVTPRTGPFGQMMSPMSQQAYIKQKPLTSTEQEQRRSQSMAWEASGASGVNPYETLPRGRMEDYNKMKIRRSPYARA